MDIMIGNVLQANSVLIWFIWSVLSMVVWLSILSECRDKILMLSNLFLALCLVSSVITPLGIILLFVIRYNKRNGNDYLWNV